MIAWKKSSYSASSGGNCVEAGRTDSGLIAIRDSKERDGGTLRFATSDWFAFLRTL
jgi:uncharacterized protein DUF397